MRVFITKRYYKRSQKMREPAKFHAGQPKGVGTDVHAVVTLDPILKKHKDLHDAIMGHERRELELWGKGAKAAHTKAHNKEPKWVRDIGGVSGFWREIKRREKNGS